MSENFLTIKPLKKIAEARYDLSRMPCNYNFIEFLVSATTRGAKTIWIDTSRGIIQKYHPSATRDRLLNILLPAVFLAGAEPQFGPHGEDIPYHVKEVLKTYREFGRINKLKALKKISPEKRQRYTVTLRDYERFPERNSERLAWEKFANRIGAFIIDDWYKEPITLDDRMALYDGAEMNFHVCGGCASLCYYSDMPFMGFWKGASEPYHRQQGFPVGSQLPWLNDRQRFVWGDDSYDNILRAWDGWQEEWHRKASQEVAA